MFSHFVSLKRSQNENSDRGPPPYGSKSRLLRYAFLEFGASLFFNFFSLFSFFDTVDCKQFFGIKFADDWIRTVDFWDHS